MIHRPSLVALLAAYAALLVLVLYVTLKEYRPMTFFTKDLLERLVATFAQAFVGVIAVTGLDAVSAKTAAAAGVAAVLSLVKSLIAKRVGDPGDASLVSGTPEG